MFDGPFSMEDVIDTGAPEIKPCDGSDHPHSPRKGRSEPPDGHSGENIRDER